MDNIDTEQTDSNLTDWANPPTLQQLKDDLLEAQSAHDTHCAEVGGWLRAYNGEQVVNAKKGRSKIVPKVIRKQAEWRYPGLSEPFLSTDDLFNVAPNTFEDKEAAIQNAMVLNYQFNHQLNKVKFVDELVRAGTDEGTVIVQVGWEVESGVREVEIEVPVMTVDPNTGMSVQIMQKQLIEKEILVKNQPTLDICEYENTVVDPTCNGVLDDAEFVIRSFENNKSGLKKDGRYHNIDNIVMSSSDSLSDAEFQNNDPTEFKFKDEPRKKFVVYEYHGYWDINGNGETEPILASWVGDTLVRMETSPFPDKKLPFVLVQMLPRRKEVYGEPDGALIEDNQRVIGAVTRGVIDILGRSANGQVGSRKDALDVVNARKYERGEDYKFNANVDPKQAFHMGTFPEVPRSAFEVINYNQNEAESFTGVKAFSDGITGNSLGSSVGGARLATDATAKRELGILRRFATGVTQIGRKVISMNQEFLSDEEIIRITDDDFVAISRDDLAGEFDVTLSISTPEADNEKAQGLEFMLQTAGTTMPFEFKQIILADIARLKKQPALAKSIAEYQPQPDPLAEQKAMLEIELLKAQIANEQAKGVENQTDATLNQAKAGTEEAKTRKLHAEADQGDLDFVENANGTKRQHEVDIMDVDHRNKIMEKVADAHIADEQSAGAVGDNTI